MDASTIIWQHQISRVEQTLQHPLKRSFVSLSGALAKCAGTLVGFMAYYYQIHLAREQYDI